MDVAMPLEDFPYLPSCPAEVNKMIKEHGDLFLDTQCKVCSAVLISESQKLTHYQSKKHANKVRRYLCVQKEKEPSLKKFKPESSESDCNNGDTDRSKVCHLCNMTFSSPVMAESHYQGKVHAKNLKLKMVGHQTAASPVATPAPQPTKKAAESSGVAATGNNNNPDRFCSICQASFNNPLMAQQHYAGKKHKKQLTKQKLMETYGPSTSPASTVKGIKGYSCTLCNIDLNSVEQYQAHISGAKHKNQMKKSGMGSPDNQHSSTQNQLTAGDYQTVAGGNQYSTDDYPNPGGEYQYVAKDNQYASGENQYETWGNQFIA